MIIPIIEMNKAGKFLESDILEPAIPYPKKKKAGATIASGNDENK